MTHPLIAFVSPLRVFLVAPDQPTTATTKLTMGRFNNTNEPETFVSPSLLRVPDLSASCHSCANPPYYPCGSPIRSSRLHYVLGEQRVPS